MNDRERGQWIDNDEGLYIWARSSRLRRAEFIRQNRAELDAIIELALAPRGKTWRDVRAGGTV